MLEEIKILKLLESVDREYYEIVSEILNNEEFLKRKNYNHHEDKSVYLHSLIVSIKSYKISKRMNIDYKSVAIAALLHDFYYNDWQLCKEKKPFLKQHGFVHSKEALENSRFYFGHLLNKKVENAILRHMFPLNIIPPVHTEGWIVTAVDKIDSLDIFKKPSKIYKYFGIRRGGV